MMILNDANDQQFDVIFNHERASIEEIYVRKLDECFDMYDLNKDGILEKHEMLHVFKYLTGLDSE